MIVVAIGDRKALRQVAARSSFALIAFAIIVSPYVIWLSYKTGQFRLEGKSSLNWAASQQILAGVEPAEFSYKIDPDLTERGVAIASNLAVIQSTQLNLREVPRHLLIRAKPVLNRLVSLIASGTPLGSPLLFGLTVLGLFRRPWRPSGAADHLFLLLILGVTTLGPAFVCCVLILQLDIFLSFSPL